MVNLASATPARCMNNSPCTSLKEAHVFMLTHESQQQSLCRSPPLFASFRLLTATPATCHKLDTLPIDIISNFYCHHFEAKELRQVRTALGPEWMQILRMQEEKKMKPGGEITVQIYTVTFFTLARGKSQIPLSEKNETKSAILIRLYSAIKLVIYSI